MLREQRLVGCHHVLARCQRRLDRGLGSPIGTADEFDHAVHIGGLSQFDRIVEPGIAGQIEPTILRTVPCRHGGNPDGLPAP